MAQADSQQQVFPSTAVEEYKSGVLQQEFVNAIRRVFAPGHLKT
jgi:hypothetical protein